MTPGRSPDGTGTPAEDPRPWARELDRAGIERSLWPYAKTPPTHLAQDLSVAIYRLMALERTEIIERASLGRDRLELVERALRLGPLLRLERSVESPGDGTKRLVLSVERLGAGTRIEAVAIPRRRDLSLCISSQTGCALGCVFCATGTLGAGRNLTAGEMVEERAWAERLAGRRVTDIVFMGMGEPLLNHDAVLEAARRLGSVEGAQISHRKIVISTAGVVPAIRRHAREKQPFQLFFSLASAIAEKRRKLMPIETSWPLEELRDAMLEYVSGRKRNRQATIEYVAIPDVNMGAEDVDALERFIEGLPAIIDVIPLNATHSGHRPPTWAEVKAFTTALRRLRVPVKIRYSAGRGAGAGCGQLAADTAEPAAAQGHMTAPPGIFSDSWEEPRPRGA